MSVMTFLRRFLPGRRAAEQTERIMTEYRERRRQEVEADAVCHSAVFEKLDSTQEIVERLEQRCSARPDVPHHHAPNGA